MLCASPVPRTSTSKDSSGPNGVAMPCWQVDGTALDFGVGRGQCQALAGSRLSLRRFARPAPCIWISFTAAPVRRPCCCCCPVGRADFNCPVRGAAVKGRLRDYYRYGRVRSCTSYWNDFWFCIRLKYVTDTEGHVSCRLIAGRMGYSEGEPRIGNVSTTDEFRRQNQFSHQGGSRQWAPLSHAL